MRSNQLKLGTVTNYAAVTTCQSWCQLKQHERFRRHGEWALNSELRSRRESKAVIVGWLAYHDDNTMTKPAALLQTPAYQR